MYNFFIFGKQLVLLFEPYNNKNFSFLIHDGTQKSCVKFPVRNHDVALKLLRINKTQYTLMSGSRP